MTQILCPWPHYSALTPAALTTADHFAISLVTFLAKVFMVARDGLRTASNNFCALVCCAHRFCVINCQKLAKLSLIIGVCAFSVRQAVALSLLFINLIQQIDFPLKVTHGGGAITIMAIVHKKQIINALLVCRARWRSGDL